MPRRACPTSPRNLLAAERREAVLRLRLENKLPYEQIAARVGISPARVSNIIHEHLREAATRREGLQELLLQESLSTIESVTRYAAEILQTSRSERNRLAAVDRLIAMEKVRIDLLGLVVQRSEVSVMRKEPFTRDELERFTAALMPEERDAVVRGDQDVFRAVMSRAGVPLQ